MSLVFLCAKGHHRSLRTELPPDDRSLDRVCPVCESNGSWLRCPPEYEVLDVLGFGGMGVVYKARDLAAGTVVALKMTHPRGHASRERVRRFHNEIEAITRLLHPNIVRVHKVGVQDGDQPYFSCEYVDGGALDRVSTQEPMSPREIALLVRTLAEAVEYAHGCGVVHRDLKPANVLVAKDGTPKIADFGLVKFMERDDEESGITRTGVIVGTPSFMSPEQARGDSSKVGPQADVYSLGVVMYSLLAGELPFRGPSCVQMIHQVVYESPPAPSWYRHGVPAELEAICLGCLQKETRWRYRTAARLAAELEEWLAGRRPAFDPERLPKAAMRWLESPRPQETVRLRTLGEELSTPLLADRGTGAGSSSDFELPEPGDPDESLFGEEAEAREESFAGLAVAEPPRPPDPPPTFVPRGGLFDGLSPDQVDALMRSASHRRFERGETIFTELDPARSLFIVTEGTVEVFRGGRNGEQILGVVETNDVLGELGLILPGGVRTAGARAATRAGLVEIPGNIFELLRCFGDAETTMTLLRNLMFILRARLARRNLRTDRPAENLPPINAPSAVRSPDDIKVLREAFSRELSRSLRRTRTLKPGEWLVRQNDAPDGFFFVHGGRLEVVDEANPYAPRVLARITSPNIVGELGFFSGHSRLAGVRAIDEASVTGFTRADYDRLRKKHPKAAINLLFTAVRLAALLIVESDWL